MICLVRQPGILGFCVNIIMYFMFNNSKQAMIIMLDKKKKVNIFFWLFFEKTLAIFFYI